MNQMTQITGSEQITAFGATAQSGTQWVLVTYNGRIAWVEYNDFFLRVDAAKATLARQGVVLPGRKWLALMNKVDVLDEFPPEDLIERCGWTPGGIFALRDGTCFVPEGRQSPTVAFKAEPLVCAMGGTFKAWKQDVAEPLAGNKVLEFCMAFAFAPALLPFSGITENAGIEIVGDPGTGKSTTQLLASSCYGPIARNAPHYWLAFDATVDGLESQFRRHNGMLMILNEAGAFYGHENARSRGGKFKSVAHRLGQGDDKLRNVKKGEEVEPSGASEFLYLISFK